MRLCHPSQLNARVQTTRPPRISTTTFIPSTRHIYVPRPVQYRTSLCLASSSSVYRLVCDFCSSGRDFASSFFQIPPHGGHPCSSLTVPTAKSVVDFHHQVVVHAAHNRVGGCPRKLGATVLSHHRTCRSAYGGFPAMHHARWCWCLCLRSSVCR